VTAASCAANSTRADARLHAAAGVGVDDGTRTHDGRIHNPGLYQLSYVHHVTLNLPTRCVMARPAGLEPATLGLAYHYCFRSLHILASSWSGLSLHRLRCRTYSLYGAPPCEQVSTGLPSARPVKVSPLRCGPLQRFTSRLEAPNRRPMLYPLELRALDVIACRHLDRALSVRTCVRDGPGLMWVVGAEGFEPPTLCSQSRCATRLRHAPLDQLANTHAS
jgi:hypothetical protein